MVIIERMAAPASDRPAAGQVPLMAERRLFLKRRWRAVADDGTEFGFDLESRLRHGCVIHRTDSADYVIWQKTEPVWEIPLATPELAALVGWKIGNLHFPVEVTPDAVRVTTDPAIAQLLEREGWDYHEAEVVFNPLRVMAHAT